MGKKLICFFVYVSDWPTLSMTIRWKILVLMKKKPQPSLFYFFECIIFGISSTDFGIKT